MIRFPLLIDLRSSFSSGNHAGIVYGICKRFTYNIDDLISLTKNTFDTISPFFLADINR